MKNNLRCFFLLLLFLLFFVVVVLFPFMASLRPWWQNVDSGYLFLFAFSLALFRDTVLWSSLLCIKKKKNKKTQ